jgi:TatD DNase family protein
MSLGLYATVGCHPTRSSEFDKYKSGPGGYLQALDDLIAANLEGKGRVVAIGECGLGVSILNNFESQIPSNHIADYDRLHFASEAVQRKHFREL